MKKILFIAIIIGALNLSFAQEQVQTLPPLTKRQCTYLDMFNQRLISMYKEYFHTTYDQNIAIFESVYEKQIGINSTPDSEEFQLLAIHRSAIRSAHFFSGKKLKLSSKYGMELEDYFWDALVKNQKLVKLSTQEKTFFETFFSTLTTARSVKRNISTSYRDNCTDKELLESSANAKAELKIIDEYYLSIAHQFGLDLSKDFPTVITWDL
jgi:hypothetical protein